MASHVIERVSWKYYLKIITLIVTFVMKTRYTAHIYRMLIIFGFGHYRSLCP